MRFMHNLGKLKKKKLNILITFEGDTGNGLIPPGGYTLNGGSISPDGVDNFWNAHT